MEHILYNCFLISKPWRHNVEGNDTYPHAVRGINKWNHSSCANFIRTFRTWNCCYCRERFPDVADTLLFRLLQTEIVSYFGVKKKISGNFWCTQKKNFMVVNIFKSLNTNIMHFRYIIFGASHPKNIQNLLNITFH